MWVHKHNEMRSPIVIRLLEQMKRDPWHIKLMRWWRVKLWVWTCMTRKYWDKEYQHYIWKK